MVCHGELIYRSIIGNQSHNCCCYPPYEKLIFSDSFFIGFFSLLLLHFRVKHNKLVGNISSTEIIWNRGVQSHGMCNKICDPSESIYFWWYELNVSSLVHYCAIRILIASNANLRTFFFISAICSLVELHSLSRFNKFRKFMTSFKSEKKANVERSQLKRQSDVTFSYSILVQDNWFKEKGEHRK